MSDLRVLGIRVVNGNASEGNGMGHMVKMAMMDSSDGNISCRVLGFKVLGFRVVRC